MHLESMDEGSLCLVSTQAESLGLLDQNLRTCRRICMHLGKTKPIDEVAQDR
jgi:hypothetical protein